MNIDQIITTIIETEGGYNDVPGDDGGPTNFGITLDTLSAWRKAACTAEDVRHLSATEARAIYEQEYVRGPGFDRIASEALRYTLVDYGVNSGQETAIMALQKVLGVTVDGKLGPKTEAAANLTDGRRLSLKVLANRARLLGQLITKKPIKAKFAAGWMDRVATQMEELA